MDTATLSTFKQPNTYAWSECELGNTLPVDRAIYDVRIQIAALNKRVDLLTKTLHNLVSQQQLETLKKTYYNV